jgi:hypothetical protein
MIEARAKHGFLCRLGNQEHTFYPRLGAMTLDSPERVKYFGLRSVRVCGVCRVRPGRSIHRRSTRHNADNLDELFRTANSVAGNRRAISTRKRARESLFRRGWKYKKRCRLGDSADKCLVRVSGFGKPPYAGLIRYERMHVYYLNYITYFTDLLLQCLLPNSHGIIHNAVHQCHQFRDPVTGRSHPRLQSVLKMTNVTAEQRVRSMFYWAHALGPRALPVVEELRVSVIVAVTCLQLILIATRGHRAYSCNELKAVFEDVGRQFFQQLETIARYLDQRRVNSGTQSHLDNPTRNQAPVPWRRATR